MWSGRTGDRADVEIYPMGRRESDHMYGGSRLEGGMVS